MSKSGRRVEMCSAMYLSSMAVYSANSVVLRERARVSHLQWSAEGTGGACVGAGALAAY